MLSALLVILVNIAVYWLAETLNTVAGKCEFIFLIGFFLVYAFFPWTHRWYLGFAEIGSVFAFLLTLLWMSVLSVDIWLGFKNIKNSSENSARFKFYCFFTFGLMVFSGLVATAFAVLNSIYYDLIRIFLHCLLFAFGVTAITAIVLLVLTGIKVFQTSKSTSQIGHSNLEAEKERFWTYFVIYLVMLITWPLETYSLGMSSSFESKIFADLLKFLSVVVVFAMLGWKKLRNLLVEYTILDSDHE